MTDIFEFTHRYTCYARERGRSPEQQMEHDKAAWPGGHMAGFLIWGQRRIRQFREDRPDAFCGASLVDHASYDAWLAKQ